jgi:hypothetical protein
MTPDEPHLESLIREGLARPDLPDGGFSMRVVTALPPAPVLPHYRAWVILGWLGTAAGAALALGACIPWSQLSDASPALSQSHPGLPPYAWTTFALAMAMAGGAAAWYLRESALES